MQNRYVGREEEGFPIRLASVKPEIKGLWGRGDWDLAKSEKVVAIVGSRKMSQYGKRVLAEIVPRLVTRGYVTVSGFMYGIDIEMHRLTIENGGRSVAILGYGIEREGETKIESKLLLMSEYEGATRGQVWTFPQRNRIVVGLADMVIVVEAGTKSGSLNSAQWGRKMGKPVYCVPGSIFSHVSLGCNWLLSQGLAKPLGLDYFSDKNYSEKVRINRDKAKLSEGESNLITHLTLEGPQSINELARRVGKPVFEIGAMLSTLALKGEVEEERGVWGVI